MEHIICPRCRGIAYLIGTRYYCHCGWSAKRETIEEREGRYVLADCINRSIRDRHH